MSPRARVAALWAALPRYLAYQVVTKAFMGVLVGPLFVGATALLLAGRADGTVTNSNLVPFLLSWRGVGWLACGLVVVVVGFVVEVAGFVTIAARSMRGDPPTTYRSILRFGAGRARNLAGLGSLGLLAYLLVVLPLTGADAPISILAGVKVPTFVMAAIEQDAALLAGYAAVVLLLTVAGALMAYTFHFLVLCDQRIGTAIANSVRLVVGQPRVFVTRFVLTFAAISLVAFTLLAVWWAFVLTLGHLLGTESTGMHITLVFLLLVQQLGTLLVAMVAVPVQVHVLTDAFLVATRRDPRWAGADVLGNLPVLPPRAASAPRTRVGRAVRRPAVFGVAGVVGLGALAVPGGLLFNDIFRVPGEARVVAHRAGGWGVPENSLPGLEHAVALGVWGVEVDVQRTADGAYVLNHDDTFARVARDPRRTRDLTLDQVRALDISLVRDGTVRVPTLEEFLVAARGRVHVVVELKGATADARMADDVIALASRLGMLDQVTLMSLDPALVRHVEDTRPEVDTGYALFWSLGDVGRLVGDLILLEEDQATEARQFAVLAAGKRPVVWTVNNPDAMRRVADSPAHAIITDEPEAVLRVVRDRHQLTGAALVEELFLGGG